MKSNNYIPYKERDYEFLMPTSEDFSDPGIAKDMKYGRPLNIWWMPFDIWLEAFLKKNSEHLQDYFWLDSTAEKLYNIYGASSIYIGTANELKRLAWLSYSDNLMAINEGFFKDEKLCDILEQTDKKYGGKQKPTDNLSEKDIKEAFETCVPLRYDNTLTFNGRVYQYAVELLNKLIERGLPIQEMYYSRKDEKPDPFKGDWSNHTFAQFVFIRRYTLYYTLKRAFEDLCSYDYDGGIIIYEYGKKEPDYFYHKVVIKPISARDVRVSVEFNINGETTYYYYEDSDDNTSLIRKYKLNNKCRAYAKTCTQ